ncbi:unnamed protein product, partial [Arabidopsis halleri]
DGTLRRRGKNGRFTQGGRNRNASGGSKNLKIVKNFETLCDSFVYISGEIVTLYIRLFWGRTSSCWFK